MRYIDVAWSHNDANDPVRLVSELDENAYEVRKMEFFRNGVVGHAADGRSVNGTKLGEAPLPSLAEINLDTQFSGVEIEAGTFELLWQQYVAGEI